MVLASQSLSLLMLHWLPKWKSASSEVAGVDGSWPTAKGLLPSVCVTQAMTDSIAVLDGWGRRGVVLARNGAEHHQQDMTMA